MPVQRFNAVRGALLLSTQGGDIDAIIVSERFALLQVFLVAAVGMVVLSVLLAGAIVGPVRRLADAAERVRVGIKSRQEIPDFTSRSDEIGHLSGALRDMTRALYNRIDAIESFAADVAHELKNPLTSMRSAVETLPLARNDASRKRLLSDHPARREAPRPADQRHLRRVAPRRRAGPRGRRAGRHGEAARKRSSRWRTSAGARTTRSIVLVVEPRHPARADASSSRVTTAASARS